MSNLKPIKKTECYDDILKYLAKAGEPGLKVGFKSLDEFYTHKDAGVTDWTGFPASGKTYFCLEVLMNLSERYGKRHGLFVPDIGSDKEILAKLVKMNTGKDFTDKYSNKITEKELSTSLDWIFHHFVIFKRSDFKSGVSPVDFWELVCTYKDDGGVIHTGLIDSWKNLKHIYSGREDIYLDEVLSLRNEMAETNQKHFHTIAHAVKTEADKAGARRIPNAWDIKGGGSWFANGKNILTVDFPYKNEYRVDVYVSKVKPEDIGRIGAVQNKIFLDLKRGRYHEEINGSKHNYAFEHEKLPSPVIIEQATIDFQPPIDEEVENLPF